MKGEEMLVLKKRFQLFLVVIMSFFFTLSSVFCENKKIKLPSDGAWTWDWGKGKTAFLLKDGRNKDLNIDMELKEDVLIVNFQNKHITKFKQQKDGSWKGTEYPSKNTIVMKKVVVKKEIIPKSIKELNGLWTLDWGDGTQVVELKNGKDKRHKKAKYKLRKTVLEMTSRKGVHVDLILQPDGSWIGIEFPTKNDLKLIRIK